MREGGTNADAEPRCKAAGHGQGGNDSLPRSYARI